MYVLGKAVEAGRIELWSLHCIYVAQPVQGFILKTHWRLTS